MLKYFFTLPIQHTIYYVFSIQLEKQSIKKTLCIHLFTQFVQSFVSFRVVCKDKRELEMFSEANKHFIYVNIVGVCGESINVMKPLSFARALQSL